MTSSRTQRRREVQEKLKIAADRATEEKRNERLNAFQEKYTKCTASILSQHNCTSNIVAIALLNAAEEITSKLLRDSNIISKKCDRNQIEPSDVHFASIKFYKTKDLKRSKQVKAIINEHRIPPISNTAMHFGPLQRILAQPIYHDHPMPKAPPAPIIDEIQIDEEEKEDHMKDDEMNSEISKFNSEVEDV